jgi:hypothetical protein
MTPVKAIVHDLRPVRRPARILYWGAAFWLSSAVLHVFALAADDWSWAGAISFRKPITFSLSIGLLLATSGWVLDRLPDRPRLAGALSWTLLVSSTIEVGLITAQTWRGRASHFNTLEAGDAAIFAAMGATIGVVSICLVTLLIWSMVSRPSDPLVAIAVIAGLALVTTGLGIGQWIIQLGNEYVASRGMVPETVINGNAGVAKFPHAVAFHGIQLFIVAAVMLRRGVQSERVKKALMWVVVASYAGVLSFASIQTMLGRAPLDPGVWSFGLALSVIGLGLAMILIVRGVDRHADRDHDVAASVA